MTLKHSSKLKMSRCHLNRFGLIAKAQEPTSFTCNVYVKTGDQEGSGTDANLTFNTDYDDGRTNVNLPLSYLTLETPMDQQLGANTTTHYSVEMSYVRFPFITRQNLISDMSGDSPDVLVTVIVISPIS